MEERLRELGSGLAIERAGSGRRLRYSAETKREVIAAATLARAGGLATKSIAHLLGMDAETLRRWLATGSEPARLRPVRVRPEVGAGALSVISPGGFRVEGLDVASAASLLRLLA